MDSPQRWLIWGVGSIEDFRRYSWRFIMILLIIFYLYSFFSIRPEILLLPYLFFRILSIYWRSSKGVFIPLDAKTHGSLESIHPSHIISRTTTNRSPTAVMAREACHPNKANPNQTNFRRHHQPTQDFGNKIINNKNKSKFLWGVTPSHSPQQQCFTPHPLQQLTNGARQWSSPMKLTNGAH